MMTTIELIPQRYPLVIYWHSYWKWPSRNRWFYPAIKWWIFHSYVNVYQRVYQHYLVGGWTTPLKNNGVRQLGLWFPIYGTIKNVPNHQPGIHICMYIWVNYNISLTWIKAIWGWFPLLTMIPVRSQWGRYNLPRYIIIYIILYIWILMKPPTTFQPATEQRPRRSIAALPSRGTVPSMASTAAVPEPWRMQCLEDHPSRLVKGGQ